MKKKFSPNAARFALLISLLFCLASSFALAQSSTPFSINESPLGAPTSPVMDYAGVLDASVKQSLEKRLIDFRDKTNPRVELAVAIVKTTNERPIFDYSLAVARGWKIGSKETDNPSALLFIAIDDRKYFTQISKDLEDELPDGVAGQLQRQNLVPAFKQGNYGKGVTDTIEAYINQIESKQTGGAATAQPPDQSKERKSGSGGSFCNIVICLIILFFFMLVIFSRFGSRKNRNDNNRWRGGGFGGGASSALPWVIGSILTSGGSSSSSSSDWGSSSSSSGGDSWGGFGGGGDFGGGGAGGDW